jgi:hypothetical protein
MPLRNRFKRSPPSKLCRLLLNLYQGIPTSTDGATVRLHGSQDARTLNPDIRQTSCLLQMSDKRMQLVETAFAKLDVVSDLNELFHAPRSSQRRPMKEHDARFRSEQYSSPPRSCSDLRVILQGTDIPQLSDTCTTALVQETPIVAFWSLLLLCSDTFLRLFAASVREEPGTLQLHVFVPFHA